MIEEKTLTIYSTWSYTLLWQMRFYGIFFGNFFFCVDSVNVLWHSLYEIDMDSDLQSVYTTLRNSIFDCVMTSIQLHISLNRGKWANSEREREKAKKK